MGQSRTSLNDARRAPGEYRPSVEISRSSWWGVKARVWSAPAFSAPKKTRWSARTLEGRFPPLGPAPRDRRHGRSVGGRRVCRDFRPTARRFRESLRRPRTPGDGPRSASAGQMPANSAIPNRVGSLRLFVHVDRDVHQGTGRRNLNALGAKAVHRPANRLQRAIQIRPPDVPAIHHTERKQQPGGRIFESNGQLARVRERDPGATRLPAGRARSRLSRRRRRCDGESR